MKKGIDDSGLIYLKKEEEEIFIVRQNVNDESSEYDKRASLQHSWPNHFILREFQVEMLPPVNSQSSSPPRKI